MRPALAHQRSQRGVITTIEGTSLAVEKKLAQLESDRALLGAVYVRRSGDSRVVYAEVCAQ